MDFEDLVERVRTQLDFAAIAADAEQRRYFRDRAWELARDARAALSRRQPVSACSLAAREVRARRALVEIEEEMRTYDARALARVKTAAE